VVRLLLVKPTLAADIDDDSIRLLRHSSGEIVNLLVEMLEMAKDRPNIIGAVYHQHWSGSDDGQQLAELAQSDPLLPEDLLAEEFRAAIIGLQQEVVAKRIDELQRLGGGHLEPAERDLLRELYERRRDLEQQRRKQ